MIFINNDISGQIMGVSVPLPF